MVIKYIIEKCQRKELAQKIGELAEMDVRYCGVPSCAYEIGFFTLDKDAVLSFPDREDTEIIERVLAGLDKMGYTAEDESEKLTISMPRTFFSDQALDNLRHIVENKHSLICHALGTEDLPIEEKDDKVEFQWFTVEKDGDSEAYVRFISVLCEFAKNLKRVVNKPDTSDNEKYAFRCFLLRLGMIGEEYKGTRKVLLRNLIGSSAFRHGKPEGDNDDAVSE